MVSDGFVKPLIAGIVACLLLFLLVPGLLLFPYWLIFLGIPLMASALCAYVVASLISKPFEKGKLVVRLASWTLLLPLFFILAFMGASLFIGEPVAPPTSISVQPLAFFLRTGYLLIFGGYAVFSGVWAVWFLGTLAIVQSGRNHNTMAQHTV